MFRERYKEGAKLQEKEEVLEAFNTLLEGHDNLGDVLLQDAAAFRAEAASIVEDEDLALYINALEFIGLICKPGEEERTRDETA